MEIALVVIATFALGGLAGFACVGLEKTPRSLSNDMV